MTSADGAGHNGDDAQTVAKRSAELMLARDRASAALGMRLLDVAPGHAVVAMTVRDDMVNGWGAAHGALVAAVADTAFAVACNSFGEVTVAAGFDVTFLFPAREGDELVATAEHRSSAGRSGVYDVTVRRGQGAGRGDGRGGGRGDEVGEGAEVVAELRGRSRSLGRPITPDARA